LTVLDPHGHAIKSVSAQPPSQFDVVILGASFAGIELYYQLRRTRAGRDLSICIVDRQAAHAYIPLIHEQLLGRLPSQQSHLDTERCVARDPKAQYVVDEITGCDPSERQVYTRSGRLLRGRFVVIAVGSELAPPRALPGLELLTRYKFADELAAARARLTHTLEHKVHIVVIGGGLSGVELAGELAHGTRLRAVEQRPVLTLIEAGAQLLAGMHPRASRTALRKLIEQGVEVRLHTKVLAVNECGLRLETSEHAQEELACDQAFWAAGIRPNPLLTALRVARTERGYLLVNPQLQCLTEHNEAHANVFACGDAVRIRDNHGEWPTMQRAIECLWQAQLVARNLLLQSASDSGARLRSHRLRRTFPYGVSLGRYSLIVFRWIVLDLGALAVWFRHFLMRSYFRRYRHCIPKQMLRKGEPEVQSR
jgi:NADH dehydrogenase